MRGRKISRTIRLIILALLLIGLPAISWYYLKKGARFRKERIEEMGNFGTIALDSSTVNEAGYLTPDSLRNFTLIIGFYPSGNEVVADTLYQRAASVDEQFGGRGDTRILLLEISPAGDSFLFRKESPGKEFFIANRTDRSVVEKAGFHIPGQMDAGWILVDNKGVIRNYYPIDELESLIVHAAIIIPPERRESIKLEREKEM